MKHVAELLRKNDKNLGRNLVVVEEAKDLRAESGENSFRPFYEWIPDQFSIPLIFKLLLSMILGFLFFGPHFRIVGENVLTDWSWVLCLIIVTAMISLYYATHTFRAMFPQMYVLLQTPESTTVDSAYMDKVKHYLSDKWFFRFGILGAVLNCGVGWFLGVPYVDPGPILTTYLGLFIAGFVCGMAFGGIIGVVITLANFLDSQLAVDYTNPDECGGFLFIGEALIKFSGVTLIVGMLVSLYIVAVKWEWEGSAAVLAPALMWIWIALPFLASLTILLAPASRANKALMNHKIRKEVELALALDKARDALRQAGTDAERREELRGEIEYYGELRAQLHRMRAWPFNTQTNIKFVILFVGNAFVAIESIRGLLSSGSGVLQGFFTG